MRLLLGILAFLLCLIHSALAEEPAEIRAGTAVSLRLDTDSDVAVYRFRPPAGTPVVHAAVAAGRDIDLFVADRLLDPADLAKARYSAESTACLEWITVRPERGDTFDVGDDLFLHVVDPDAGDTVLEASLFVWAEGKGRTPLLPPGERIILEVPSGEKQVVRNLFLPEGVEFAGITAECVTGRPGLRLVREATVVPGVPRGEGTVAFLGGKTRPVAGAWRVEVERPAGSDAKTPLRVAVEAIIAPRLVIREDDALFVLAGAKGEGEVEIPEDDWAAFVIDVLPETHGFEITAALSEGDVDLYAARQHPVDLEEMNYRFATWKEDETDTLAVVGGAPLPIGRYWIRAVHHDGSDEDCTISWKLHEKAPAGSSAAVLPEQLEVGGRAAVRFKDNQEFCWFALPEGVGAGVWAQVLFSDKDVELAVARSDTREILQFKETERNDEYLRIDEDLLLPKGVRVLVGVYRWSVRGEVGAGALHIGAPGRPVPTTAYFPPYPFWSQKPSETALAATVEVELADSGGSGVVVSPTGLILTCHHVIEDGGEMLVSFPTNDRGRPRQVYEVVVLHQDEDLDLALLAPVKDVFGTVRDRKSLRLPFVPVYRVPGMGGLRLGEPLRLVGYGHSGSTRFGSNLLVFSGVLSGIEEEGGEARWLLTDCRTGEGNSGGAYFNASHVLVGIHNMAVGKTGSALAYGRPTGMIPERWCELIRKEGGRLIQKEGGR